MLKDLASNSFKGYLTGVYKKSKVGFYNIGALIIRMGFGGPLYKNTKKGTPVIIKAPILHVAEVMLIQGP